MPAREVPERLWHEVALAREDASPCLRLGNLPSAVFNSVCTG